MPNIPHSSTAYGEECGWPRLAKINIHPRENYKACRDGAHTTTSPMTVPLQTCPSFPPHDTELARAHTLSWHSSTVLPSIVTAALRVSCLFSSRSMVCTAPAQPGVYTRTEVWGREAQRRWEVYMRSIQQHDYHAWLLHWVQFRMH